MEHISNATDFRCLPPLKPYTDGLWRGIFSGVFGGHHMVKLLMTLTDCSGKYFAGKRIAVLGNKTLALVSRQARVGDVICNFNDDSKSRYILRLLDKKTFSPDLDLSLIDFFTSIKEERRKDVVEYTHDGRLVWKDVHWRSRYLTVINDYMSKKLLKAGLRLPNVCDDHGDFIINPILKAKLDLVTSNMIRATWGVVPNIEIFDLREYEKFMIVVQTDTSKVEHFEYVGECIIDLEADEPDSSRTGPDQESNYSFSEWYEEDLPAEIPSDLDGDFDEESLKEFDDLDINNPTPSDPTTFSNTNGTSTTLEMELRKLIRPLPNMIIALH